MKHTTTGILLIVQLLAPLHALSQACKADSNTKIRICFQEPYFQRCKKQIRVPFYVDVNNWTHHYNYAVNVYRDSVKRQNWRAGFATSTPLSRTGLTRWHNLPLPGQTASDLNGTYIVEVNATDVDDPGTSTTESKTIEVTYKRHIYALVVGVSKYQYGMDVPTHPESQITNLHFAAHDADTFAKFVQEFFPEDKNKTLRVKPLLDSDATKDSLNRELSKATQPDAACEGDLFIFYYSGHTFASTDEASRWIGTWDINPNELWNALRYDELLADFRPIKADKIIIFDSCFSGMKKASDVVDSSFARGEVTEANEGKLEVSAAGQLRRDVLPAEFTEQEQNEMVQDLLRLGQSSSFYSAAEMNRQAQEGVVVPAPVNGRSFFFLDERIPKSTDTGHGLFTYALMVAFERQMSANHRHPDFAEDGLAQTRWQAHSCSISFATAAKDSLDVIGDIGKSRNRPLQQSWSFGKQDPAPIECHREQE